MTKSPYSPSTSCSTDHTIPQHAHALKSGREKKQVPINKKLWTYFLLSTILLGSLGALHFRWQRPIITSPIVLPEIPYAFDRHRELEPFDAATQARWDTLISRDAWWDMSWVTGRYPGSKTVVVRGIDMFHKMHCLIALRAEFTALVLGDPERRAAWRKEGAKDEADLLHLGHCFDFLRQGFRCAADATLEALEPGFAETTGEGVVHQCRDWKKLMAYAGLPNPF
ncbi:hypothetical protein LZ31DRAFT_591062 [Colletotrichum somersetense]|nr:hypothetical protein LZ31DRAFT_591062 [Colletotrichum somersetense]